MRTPAVVNTSPLIFLAKLGRLEALRIFEPVLTTPEALAEVMAGLEEGFRDAHAVQDAVDRGAIETRRAPRTATATIDLGPGEDPVLSLARGVRGVTVVVDDLPAIKAARGMGMRVRSTPFVLLDNVEAGRLEIGTFEELLQTLLGFGYHMGGNLYLRLLEQGRRL